jgi:hypothetical protein
MIKRSFTTKLLIPIIFGGLVGFAATSYYLHSNAKAENEEVHCSTHVYIDVLPGLKIHNKEISYLNRSLINSFDRNYFVKNISSKDDFDYTHFNLEASVKNYNFLFYVPSSNSNKERDNFNYEEICSFFQEVSAKTNCLFVLNSLVADDVVNNEGKFYLNQGSIRTLFSNDEKILVSNFNPEARRYYPNSSSFMRTIFEVLSELKSYPDLTTFFEKVQNKCYKSDCVDSSFIFFTNRTNDGNLIFQSLSQVCNTRNDKINLFTDRLNYANYLSDKGKMLNDIKEIATSNCEILVQDNDDFSDYKTYNINAFINYLNKEINDKKASGKNTKFQIFSINNQCCYNITHDKIEKFAVKVFFSDEKSEDYLSLVKQ